MSTGPELAFTKLEGLGNDFVLIDARSREFRPDAEAARQLCDRRTGIGCDQLLVLVPATTADCLARVEIRNADGSAAEQCGNGMRAIARWLDEAGELSAGTVLETAGGEVPVHSEDNGSYAATLPAPDFTPRAWGLAAPADGWHPPGLAANIAWYGVSMGNPHVVIEWPRAPDGADLASVATSLAGHADLARGANVGLAFIDGDGAVVLRVHERGAGPTPACGSGACAAACALIRAGRARSPVTVHQPGGTLVINWPGGDRPVCMAGLANRVFDGVIAWPKRP